MSKPKPNLVDLLEVKFEAPKWLLVYELASGRGWDQRRIDVAGYPCWKSAGNHAVAFELKASRGDFLRELKTPIKRRWVEEHFSETWFVTERDVVKEESEVPETWGWLVRTKKGDGLRVMKRPTPRDVPDLGEVELMALRQLGERLVREGDRRFHFEGQELTPEDLRVLVQKGVETEREILLTARSSAVKEIREAQEARSRLEEPFKMLRELAGAGWKWNDLGEVTAADIKKWVKLARAKPDDALLPALRKVHREIGKVLDASGGD